jgi:predicted tellurium resistance membrane protein TerC
MLFASSFVWGISIIAVVIPWPAAINSLNGLGAGVIPNDPMLDYWLRMAAAAFTIIGMLFFVTALWPAKYQNLVGLLGLLQVFEGIVLLVHGLRLELRPFPFYADTAFCLFAGALIWALRNEAKATSDHVNF